MPLLTSAHDVHKACDTLLHAADSIIAMDCEGEHLGRKGKISIVQAATAKEAFVFDVSETKGAVFDHGLREVLQSPAVVKLFFDCRHDADALQHLHNIRLSGVCDLQLLELMSRDDDEDDQLRRLHGCLHHGNVRGSPHLYKSVHKLAGLKDCLEHFELGGGDLKKQIRAKFRADGEYWMQRPLPPEAMEYAMHDVQSLFDLLDALAAERHEVPSLAAKDDAITEASARYADLFRCQGVQASECYYQHALLPLCVVEGIPPVCVKGHGPPMTCKNCKQTLPRAAFPKIAQKVPNKCRCDVCRAIDVDISTRVSWNRVSWNHDSDSDSDSDGPSSD